MFNFLKNLFSRDKEPLPEKNPDNTRLLFLLNNYKDHPSQANYELAMKELMDGNCFLIIPSVEDGKKTDEWITLPEKAQVKFASVFDNDGLKVLGAFTDEAALTKWANKAVVYIALKARAVIDICEANKINRVVINSGSGNMFVLSQATNITTIEIEKEVNVKVGPTSRPLQIEIVQKLISNFSAIDNVLEAYQYGQLRDEEISLVIAVKLHNYTDDGKKAVIYAIEDVLSKEIKSGALLDIFFLESDEWYETVVEIQESLLYKR